MRVQFALGAEADLASSDELSSGLRESRDSIISAMRKGRERYVARRIPASVVAVAATTSVLTFGEPPDGTLWYVVHVGIFGSDDRTAVAGATAALYIGNPVNPSLSMCLGPGLTVPNTWSYSKQTIPVHSGEDLFVNVYGAAGAQQLVGTATVHQYHPDPEVMSV